MNIGFTVNGWGDFNYWHEHEPDVVEKIRDLIRSRSIKQAPFKGLGKPEPLEHNLKGFWSRRITGEHRLVYQITGTKGLDVKCSIIQCRFHYAS